MAGKGGGKLHEKHQLILANMLREEENKFCADCHAKGMAIYFRGGVRTASVCVLVPRTAVGLLEPGRLHVHQVCRDPSQPGSTHLSRQECQSRLLDTRTDRSMISPPPLFLPSFLFSDHVGVCSGCSNCRVLQRYGMICFPPISDHSEGRKWQSQ